MEFRPSHRNETYRLNCWRCDREVELPESVRRLSCPHCGALLTVEWRAGCTTARQHCYAKPPK
jgi:DNA-directed RNA polymerase subunit RPC12/RpoP